jgi:hypothetical protein
MSKLTAVEWLIEELGEYFPNEIGGIHLMVEKAKEMEKEQTIAFADKYDAYVVRGGTLTAEQYYKEQYGGKNESNKN